MHLTTVVLSAVCAAIFIVPTAFASGCDQSDPSCFRCENGVRLVRLGPLPLPYCSCFNDDIRGHFQGDACDYCQDFYDLRSNCTASVLPQKFAQTKSDSEEYTDSSIAVLKEELQNDISTVSSEVAAISAVLRVFMGTYIQVFHVGGTGSAVLVLPVSLPATCFAFVQAATSLGQCTISSENGQYILNAASTESSGLIGCHALCFLNPSV
eukprot:ANDGO_01465.mRNA.1 hypothetical protein